MALEILRKKQKTVIWIAAILVIPSFVIFWGGNSGGGNSSGGDPAYASVGGATLHAQEFFKFQERMRALGSGLRYDRMPRLAGENTAILVGLYSLHMADTLGIGVAKEEIGTAIRNNPLFTDPDTNEFTEKYYRERVKQSLRMNSIEHQRALAERFRIQKFEQALDSTAIASPFDAYCAWAQETAKLSYQTLERKTESFMDKARANEKDLEGAIKTYVEDNKAKDPTLYTPARWRMEYVMARYADQAVPTISDDEVKRNYEAGKETEFKGKELAAVKDEIKAKLLKDNSRANARRTMRRVEEDVINAHDPEAGELTAKAVAENPLCGKKVIAGATAEAGKLQTAAEIIAADPVLKNASALKDTLDFAGNEMDAKKRERIIDAIKKDFTSNAYAEEGVFYSDTGAFKIRVLEFQPGELRDIKADTALHAEIENRILKAKASALAKEEVDGLRTAILDGKTEGIGLVDHQEPLSKSPVELYEALVNTPSEALPLETGDGYRILVLRGRNIASLDDFNKLPLEERRKYYQRTMISLRGFAFYGQNYAGERLRELVATAFEKGEIKMLVEHKQNDGHDEAEGN